MRLRELLAAVTPTSVPRDGAPIKVMRGKSAIKRASILGGSGCAVSASGSAAINEVNLWVAVSSGRQANSAASSRGSMPRRASTVRTLSNTPFLSSPIGANRKASNFDPSGESDKHASFYLPSITLGHIGDKQTALSSMAHGAEQCSSSRAAAYLSGLIRRDFCRGLDQRDDY